jgi:hypothetical protein
MKTTVTEALRLKNELSTIVRDLNYKIISHLTSYGVTTENDVVTSRSEASFEEVESNLLKALSYSEELNRILAEFNTSSGISVYVRKMQNEKLLLGVYTQALPKTKSTETSKFENLANERKQIIVRYKPDVNGKEIKDKISECKNKIRIYQKEIERLNQIDIEFTFAYSDIESLTQ